MMQPAAPLHCRHQGIRVLASMLSLLDEQYLSIRPLIDQPLPGGPRLDHRP